MTYVGHYLTPDHTKSRLLQVCTQVSARPDDPRRVLLISRTVVRFIEKGLCLQRKSLSSQSYSTLSLVKVFHLKLGFVECQDCARTLKLLLQMPDVPVLDCATFLSSELTHHSAIDTPSLTMLRLRNLCVICDGYTTCCCGNSRDQGWSECNSAEY